MVLTLLHLLLVVQCLAALRALRSGFLLAVLSQPAVHSLLVPLRSKQFDLVLGASPLGFHFLYIVSVDLTDSIGFHFF